ncbi:dTDP-4-dehydrorhamnose 3,5-epimerase [Paenibacillus hexagrammi]|uniref:dTDP-4-dehydrorhamnose 3,5-epimerase n=1 Tax=Paenibacillus hexagrammi TaxID=2908839 RepID=A0ABY3SM25_9BACL|nr:dTDP-4-dehydrorhamnose 3,5-epimerase [Paenibacillus sp. YPD9-1]UJF34269.1 dTDP-4-dehydrorhamnose 3,5-epimerase [Paenibacillus sp. YPD9-1]
MEIIKTKFEGVSIIIPRCHEDDRGFFMETYNEDILRQNNIFYNFVQDNHSLSLSKGILRGLHYQIAPKAQAKLIRVIAGAIFDVVVDIRQNSPTFGDWMATILSKENKQQLLVPKGFAHGFCTLEPNTEVQYKVDEFYSSAHDRGIRWNDPNIGIDWPVVNPILSERDKYHPLLVDAIDIK